MHIVYLKTQLWKQPEPVNTAKESSRHLNRLEITYIRVYKLFSLLYDTTLAVSLINDQIFMRLHNELQLIFNRLSASEKNHKEPILAV